MFCGTRSLSRNLVVARSTAKVRSALADVERQLTGINNLDGRFRSASSADRLSSSDPKPPAANCASGGSSRSRSRLSAVHQARELGRAEPLQNEVDERPCLRGQHPLA